MPSKGNPIVPVRFPRPLLEAVVAQVERLNSTSPAAPPDLSEFVRRAVEEKLAHYARSRRRRPNRRRGCGTPACPSGEYVWGVLPKGGC